MNILHVLSQLELTGAESYAIALAEQQISKGHHVFICSDQLHSATQAKYLSLNIDNRRLTSRIRNIKSLHRMMSQHHIDIVHAHSRAASWVASIAAKLAHIPCISTIHGRQSPRLGKKLFNCYGDAAIAVCDNIKQQMTPLKIDQQRIAVIPNLVDLNSDDTTEYSAVQKLIIAGRTTGAKGRRTSEFLQHLAETILNAYPSIQIQLIGGKIQDLPAAGQRQFNMLSTTYPERIINIGFVKNLPEYLASATCVIAAGRIAIEALMLGRPVLALGEGCYSGLINSKTLEQAIASNFGDIDIQEKYAVIEYQAVYNDLIKTLNRNKPISKTLIKTIVKQYSSHYVYPKIMDLYLSTRMRHYHPKHIPILMYHKITDDDKTYHHRTFVDKARFETQLKSLKLRGFSTLTLGEYCAYRNGKRSLKNFPKKPIMITFDDGYQNNLDYALPLLKKYHFKATWFILGDRGIRNNDWDRDDEQQLDALMSRQQLQQLLDNGMEIGAHTMTHAKLTELDDNNAYREIKQSKTALEKEFNIPIVSFAYPFGNYNQTMKALTQKAGFSCAVATDNGGMHIEDDLFEIFRVNMFPSDHWFKFWKKSSTFYRQYYQKRRGH